MSRKFIVFRPFFAASLGIMALISQRAEAISVDEFNGDQVLIAGAGTSTKGGIASVTALGNNRSIIVEANAGNPQLHASAATNLGQFSHSQDTTISGSSLISWDGDNDPNTFNYTGLNGLNFLQDASSAFQIVINSFDYPNQKSVDLAVTVYTDQTHYSTGKITLSAPVVSQTTFTVPFAAFVAGIGSVGPVDFQSIGAVQLLVDANTSPAADIALEFFGTNQCPRFPDANGKVVDECGVCGGDNSSCADCKGIPNGNSVPGTGCSNGELGVCAGGTYTNACLCKRNTEPSTEKCDGIDNDCDGQLDQTFPLKNQNCQAGQGICQQAGTYVCTADGSLTCTASAQAAQQCEESKGCDGNPNSGLISDVCGVCGGNGTSCLGCDGMPNSGLVKDVCNVCGGNGTSCLDCKNVVNGTAQKDRCGVCQGDGKSCLNCTVQNLAPIQTNLDIGAKHQEALIKQLLRRLALLKKDKASKRYIAKASSLAHDLQIKNWVLSWTTFPTLNQNCDNQVFCTTEFNTAFLQEYRDRSNQLLQLGLEIARKLKDASKGTLGRSEQGIVKKMAQVNDDNIKNSFKVPETHQECGN